MPELKHVDIYTDGACSGNPGAGGWAAILIYKGVEKQVSGYNKDTTNNRMELFAIICVGARRPHRRKRADQQRERDYAAKNTFLP